MPLAFGAAAETRTEVPTGVRFSRTLTPFYRASAGAVETISTRIQTRKYLSRTTTVSVQHAVLIVPALRTASAYVDRAHVRVAFQLRSSDGDVRVSRPANRDVLLRAKFGSDEKVAFCDTSGVQKSNAHYLGYCQTDSLPPLWFASGGTAQVEVELRMSGVLVRSVLAGSMSIVQQPHWWDQLSSVLSSAGVFATLPVSPLYVLEPFSVDVWAHTGGNEIDAFQVQLFYDADSLDYVKVTQSVVFNTLVSTHDASLGRLQFSAVGKPLSATSDDATGPAVHLLTVTLRFRTGVSAGTRCAPAPAAQVVVFLCAVDHGEGSALLIPYTRNAMPLCLRPLCEPTSALMPPVQVGCGSGEVH